MRIEYLPVLAVVYAANDKLTNKIASNFILTFLMDTANAHCLNIKTILISNDCDTNYYISYHSR